MDGRPEIEGSIIPARAPNAVPKSNLEVLSQIIGSEEGRYRLRAAQRVHYLTIPTDVFDEDTMCIPFLLIPKLPDIPDGPWIRMHISKGETKGELKTTISNEPLLEIMTTWHPQRIDTLSLPKNGIICPGLYDTTYEGRPAVAKVANFDWEISRIERETWAYGIINQNLNSDEAPLAPNFLGHLTEQGRVMGFLMEEARDCFN